MMAIELKEKGHWASIACWTQGQIRGGGGNCFPPLLPEKSADSVGAGQLPPHLLPEQSALYTIPGEKFLSPPLNAPSPPPLKKVCIRNWLDIYMKLFYLPCYLVY